MSLTLSDNPIRVAMLQCCTVGVNCTLCCPTAAGSTLGEFSQLTTRVLAPKIMGRLLMPDSACRILHCDQVFADNIQLLQGVWVLRVFDVPDMLRWGGVGAAQG